MLIPRPVEEGFAYLGAGEVGQGGCFWGGEGQRWPGDVELGMPWVHDEAIHCDFRSLHGDDEAASSWGVSKGEKVDVRLAVLAYRYLDMSMCFVSPRRRLWNVGLGVSVVTTRTIRKRKGPQEGGVINMAAWFI